MNRYFLLLALSALCVSCAGTHDPSDEGSSEIQQPFTLSVDKEFIESDGTDKATLTITDANGKVLTDKANIRNTSFHLEETDEWFSGMGTDVVPNEFVSIIDGTYTFSAMYNGIMCENKVKVTSRNRNKYEVFHKNVPIYRLTGTWCQFCPEMTKALNNINDYTKSHSIIMEFHNNDEFSIQYNSALDFAAFLKDRFGGTGYPYCIYGAEKGDKDRTVSGIQACVKEQLIAHPAATGIKASSSVSGADLTIDVTVKASSAGRFDLGYAILQDNSVPKNEAYESVYNDVVLGITGNFYASSSDAFDLAKDAEKTIRKTWSSDILKGDNLKNLRIVLFTMVTDGGKSYIDNAVTFHVGESVDYKYY